MGRLKEMIEINQLINNRVFLENHTQDWTRYHEQLYNYILEGKVSERQLARLARKNGKYALDVLNNLYVKTLSKYAAEISRTHLRLQLQDNAGMFNELIQGEKSALTESARGDKYNLAKGLRAEIFEYERLLTFADKLPKAVSGIYNDRSVTELLNRVNNINGPVFEILEEEVDKIDTKLMTELFGEETVGNLNYNMSLYPALFLRKKDIALKYIDKMPITRRDLDKDKTSFYNDEGRLIQPTNVTSAIRECLERECENRDELVKCWRHVGKRIMLQGFSEYFVAGSFGFDAFETMFNGITEEIGTERRRKENAEARRILRRKDANFEQIEAGVETLANNEVIDQGKNKYYYKQLEYIVNEIWNFNANKHSIAKFSDILLQEPRVYSEIEEIIYNKVESRVDAMLEEKGTSLTEVERNCLIAKYADKKIKEFYARVAEINPEYKRPNYDREVNKAVKEL